MGCLGGQANELLYLTLGGQLLAPANVAASPGDGEVAVSWESVAGADSYNIYWDTASGVASARTNVITNAAAPYTHIGLTNGSAYYYVVVGVNTEGEGVESGEVNATPQVPAPGAPTGVSAAAGAAGSGQITVNWNAVTGADTYNIYFSTTPGIAIGTAGVTSLQNVTAPYLHTGLTNGQTYHYVVTANSVGGESPVSAEVNATLIPDAPAGVSAAPGNNSAIVSWTEVTGATSYNIYYSTNNSFAIGDAGVVAVPGGVSPQTVTGLSNGTTYYFIVTAVNASGESGGSVQSSTVPVPDPPPAPPSSVTATAGAAGSGEISVSWPAVTSATSYNIYWDTVSGVTTGTGTKITGVTSPYLHIGLTNGLTYYYIVTAVGNGGEGAASAESSAALTPDAPVTVTAYPGNGSATVSWSASTGAVSYNIYYSTNSAFNIGDAGVVAVPGGVSPQAVTGLSNGTTYYFIVTAVNNGGESLASSRTAVIPNILPGTGMPVYVDLTLQQITYAIKDPEVQVYVDATWQKMAVVATNQANNGLLGYNCNLDGSSCAVTVINTGTEGNTPSMAIAAGTGRPLLVSASDINGENILYACTRDFGTCSPSPISADASKGNDSGLNPDIVYDIDVNKVYTAAMSNNTGGGSVTGRLVVYKSHPLIIPLQNQWETIQYDIGQKVGWANGRIADSGWDPSIVLDTISATRQIIVATRDNNNNDRLSLFRCDVPNFTSCSHLDASAAAGSVQLGGVINGSGREPAAAIDPVNNRVLIATRHNGNGDQLYLYSCALDFSDCFAENISADAKGLASYNNSGFTPSISVDKFNKKVLIVTEDAANNNKPALYRCDLATGTNCSYTDISAGQGNKSGITPSTAIDWVNSKLITVTENQAAASILGIFKN